MSQFESARADIQTTLEKMKQLRRRLEASLGMARTEEEAWQVKDLADVFAGPSPTELVQAKDASEPPPPKGRGREWWREEMEKHWPEGPRKNPNWGGRRR